MSRIRLLAMLAATVLVAGQARANFVIDHFDDPTGQFVFANSGPPDQLNSGPKVATVIGGTRTLTLAPSGSFTASGNVNTAASKLIFASQPAASGNTSVLTLSYPGLSGSPFNATGAQAFDVTANTSSTAGADLFITISSGANSATKSLHISPTGSNDQLFNTALASFTGIGSINLSNITGLTVALSFTGDHGGSVSIHEMDFSVVPEPATILTSLSGGLCLLGLAIRRARKRV